MRKLATLLNYIDTERGVSPSITLSPATSGPMTDIITLTTCSHDSRIFYSMQNSLETLPCYHRSGKDVIKPKGDDHFFKCLNWPVQEGNPQPNPTNHIFPRDAKSTPSFLINSSNLSSHSWNRYFFFLLVVKVLASPLAQRA